jgi:hypothetical protein
MVSGKGSQEAGGDKQRKLTHSHRKAEVQAHLPVLLSLDNSSGIKRQEQEKNI